MLKHGRSKGNCYSGSDGYESDLESESATAELTFFSCYDNLADFPDFELDPNETIWDPKPGGKKISAENNYRGNGLGKFLSDNDESDKNSDVEFEDSPLPLRERLSRKSSGNENVLNTPSLYDRRYRTMRDSICPKVGVSRKIMGEENQDSRKNSRGKDGSPDEIEIITILDDSIDPVFSSTKLEATSHAKVPFMSVENLTQEPNEDSRTLSPNQLLDKSGRNRNCENSKGSSKVQKRIFEKHYEKPRSGDSLVKEKNALCPDKFKDQSERLPSSSDDEGADEALEAFFRKMHSPKRTQSAGDNLSVFATNKTPKNRYPKEKAASRYNRIRSHNDLTQSRPSKFQQRGDEFAGRSRSRCSMSHEDGDFLDAEKIKKLSAKISSESEDAKEIDEMMSSRLIPPAVKSPFPRKEVDLADAFDGLSLDIESPVSPKKDPRRKYTQTPASVPRDGKVTKKCWFLGLTSVDPSRFKAYVRDFDNMTQRQFMRNREKQTKMLFSVFNQTLFNSMFCEETFGIVWNKNLTRTAGRTNCISKKSVVKSPSGKTRSKEMERLANIELASKVLDSADRLRDTLVHEMCHAAVWLQTGDRSAGHGPAWKKWAHAVNSTFRFLPLVTRCHNYQINYKYWYQCNKCPARIGRFSKSIDTEKQVCGRCHGKLQLVSSNSVSQKKREESSSMTGSGGDQNRDQESQPRTPKTPNQYALFVKESWSSVKKPGMTFAETHKEINRLYREKKDKESYNKH